MKINRLILFCLLLFVSGKSVAQVLRTGHYYFQNNKENTDKVKLRNIRNISFILQVDDQVPRRVSPSRLTASFVIHNLPAGEHVIRVKSSSKRKNIDTNYTEMVVMSDGNGKVLRVFSPKIKGFKPGDAVGISILSTFVGLIVYIQATWNGK